ncbi:hypothetical protein MgSA37_02646 [Mucilaginibacter gotjawali]|uniref:Uncharacterized protein n=2 Tax=Mucilaginibacter gotjawali TaxID=1550579 RepID=A0A839SBY4_9SPHI|nr:hypothetical protein [Mucilaginibacter gotjawali]BAU54470.1 hypothetical protein MgSA37_02646 [Mucilaginibacter gotjawali]
MGASQLIWAKASSSLSLLTRPLKLPCTHIVKHNHPANLTRRAYHLVPHSGYPYTIMPVVYPHR